MTCGVVRSLGADAAAYVGSVLRRSSSASNDTSSRRKPSTSALAMFAVCTAWRSAAASSARDSSANIGSGAGMLNSSSLHDQLGVQCARSLDPLKYRDDFARRSLDGLQR